MRPGAPRLASLNLASVQRIARLWGMREEKLIGNLLRALQQQEGRPDAG